MPVTPITPILTATLSLDDPSLILALAVAALFALAAIWRIVRDTTLTPAWCWALAAVVVLAGVELVARTHGLGDGTERRLDPLRYAAAVLTFAPQMAVLGARRPFHRAWQWTVLCYWVLLAVPAAEAMLFRPGEPFHVAGAWTALLLISLFLEIVNYLPTRFWPSCLLLVAGQWMLLADHLPWSPAIASGARPIWAIGLFAAAGALIALGFPRAGRPVHSLDPLWLGYRDLFGTVWALRGMGRLQVAADAAAWRVRLTWNGFRHAGDKQPDDDEQIAAEEQQTIETALRSLLRRFVGEHWFADRLPPA